MTADSAVKRATAIVRIGQSRRCPTDGAVEGPGDREHGIAPRLDLESARVHAPQQPVLRIDGVIGCRETTAQLIRRWPQDLAVQLLERPAPPHPTLSPRR